MNKNTKNKNDFKSMLKGFSFIPTELGIFGLISNKISLHITNGKGNIVDAFNSKAMHKEFINEFLTVLPDAISIGVTDYDYRITTSNAPDVSVVASNYIDKIEKALDPLGVYKDQYELISKLTEYDCQINAVLRVGLKRSEVNEYELLPVIVLEINMKSDCKLKNVPKCKVNKLTLDTFILN